MRVYPAIIFAPNKTLAAQTYSEMRDFFPENAVEYFVSYYDFYQPEAYVPARDLFIEKDAAVNDHIEQMRLAATKSILERRDTIIVATVSAIYGIGSPESYTTMRMILRQGDRRSQRQLINQLVKIQYKRSDMEFNRGTFRVRATPLTFFRLNMQKLPYGLNFLTMKWIPFRFLIRSRAKWCRKCSVLSSIRRATTLRRATKSCGLSHRSRPS